jgi:hypothetical protein
MAASSSLEEETEEEIATGQGGNGALEEGLVSLSEWQGWGTDSPLPATVMEIIKEMKELERDFGSKMRFGGVGGKIKVICENCQISAGIILFGFVEFNRQLML